MSHYLIDPAPSPRARLLLAHGAGAPMDSAFMAQMAALLASRGVEVVRFEFPYMAERRASGKRRPPDPLPALIASMQRAADHWAGRDGLPLFAGGKSLGGRVASWLTDARLRGAVALGFPFHPQAKPEQLRLDTLQARSLPLLIVQGSRDPLGSRDQVAGYALDPTIAWCWLADGDHDFKPRRASGFRQAQHLVSAADAVAKFIDAGSPS